MLELIIAILLSMGLNFTNPSDALSHSPEAISKVRADIKFNDLGGENELSKYITTTDDPPPADIVVTVGVDPSDGN